MSSPDHSFDPPRSQPDVTTLRAAVRRMTDLALVWLGFGIIVGYLTAPQPTPIGIAAGVIAGMIVLPPVGAMLGAIGCRWRESLNGGVCGLAVGTALAIVQGRPDAATVSGFGVIVGGLVGATVLGFYRFPRLVFVGVRRLARSDDRVDKSVPV